MKTSKILLLWLLIPCMSAVLNAQTDSSKLLSQFLFPEFSKGTVKFKNGSVTSARMRQLLKLFQNKEKELKKFIKDNDISVSKTEDLIRLLNYCNGL